MLPVGTLPPAQPAYVLRGHSAPVHSIQFSPDNSRLLTGDAEGWIVSWSLAYKRPVAVWHAHDSAVLGLAWWGADRVISHGRDRKLVVWKLGLDAEDLLSKTLPVESAASAAESRKPELLHLLTVNTMNFCAFSSCLGEPGPRLDEGDVEKRSGSQVLQSLLVAVPGTLDSDGVDIFQLPTEKQIGAIPADKTVKTGMVMALSLSTTTTGLRLLAGYESGHTATYLHDRSSTGWTRTYLAQPHTQPVLSLAISPLASSPYYLTSSADATVAKHPLHHHPDPDHDPDRDPDPAAAATTTTTKPGHAPLSLLRTKHAGQQGLRIRADGRIFATAGWDSRVRVYAARTMRELAVLKWHREGCYATAFARVVPGSRAFEDGVEAEGSGGEEGGGESGEGGGARQAVVVRKQAQDAVTLAHRRDQKTTTTHWLAAGSKDGKVSLWDIY